MAKTKEQKKEDVKKLAEDIDKQKSMIFIAYEGLKAADMFALRKILKEAGCKIMVVKKTILAIVLKEKKIDFDAKGLTGQIGLVLGFEDEISPAKLSYNFSKENENLKLLGGYFENKIIDAQEVMSLAQIPSKQELLAKVVGSIFSPVSGFVNVLQGNIRSLVYILSKVKN
jgi:large subunit ribosomal protein L10